MRRILQRVDGDALDEAIGAWLAARDPDRPQPDHDLGRRARRSLAVDGKTVRGARRADGTRVHLLAAMTGTSLVAAQREVSAKTNEITVFRPMLADLELADTVVTFDVLHSQTAHARFLVEGAIQDGSDAVITPATPASCHDKIIYGTTSSET